MADYYPLLARAVAALPNAGREARFAIYERARKALMAQLRSIEPPVSEEHLEVESKALDAAIARLEAELAVESAAAGALDLAPAPPAAGAAPPPPLPLEAAPPPPGGQGAPARTTDPRRLEPRSGVAPSAAPLKPIMPARGAPPLRPASAGAAPRPVQGAPGAPRPPLGQAGRPAPPNAPGASLRQPPATETRSKLGALFSSKQHPPLPDEAAPKPAPAPDLAPAEEAPVAMRAPGRPDLPRPAAPIRPEARGGVPRQVLIWIPLVVLIGAGIGFAAWQLRVPQEEFTKPRAGQEARQGSSKINDRAGAPGEPAPSQQAAQSAPAQPPAQGQQAAQQPQQQTVAPQRAAMLVQAAVNDQQNVDTHVGSASWRLEESRRPGSAGLPALRADIDLPSVGLRVVFLIEKNNDPTLRASHMLTFRFLPQEGARLPPVAEIGSTQMRNETAPAVEPLAGAQAKITDQIYIVALSADPALAARNLELIRSRGWFDMPLRLADGRVAKITLEKGPLGERLLAQAIEAWQR